MRFSGAMVGSHDAHRLGAFYTGVLGKPSFQSDAWYGWHGAAQLVIGEHSDVTGSNELPQRIMLTVEVDDVRGEFERLTGLGAPTVAAPYQPDGGDGEWLATVADPDGNYLQLHTAWGDV